MIPKVETVVKNDCFLFICIPKLTYKCFLKCFSLFIPFTSQINELIDVKSKGPIEQDVE